MTPFYITYEQVVLDYPETVAKYIGILRNSDSTFKDYAIDKIKWMYVWGFLTKKSERKTIEELSQMEYNQRLEYELSCLRVDVVMTARSFIYGDRVSGEIPTIIKEFVSEILKFRMKIEQTRFNYRNVITSIPPFSGKIKFEGNGVEDFMNEDGGDNDNFLIGGGNNNENIKPIAGQNMAEIDGILDKIRKNGIDSLTEDEKKLFNSASSNL